MQIHELNTFTEIPGSASFLAIDNGFDTGKISINSLLSGPNEEIEKINRLKVDIPLSNGQPTYGTSGQLLRTKGNGATEWTDIGLPTDEQTEQAVSDWLDAHPEATTTVEDGSISTVKIQDGAVTADKLSNLVRKSPFYDVTMYGILPDTGEDLYDDIFDFLHNVVAATGGTVYFPQGTYKISDTIFIPPMTVFMGSGPATKILFTEDYPSFGVGLSNGGSYVGIVNMTVDNTDDSEIVYGSMTGAIGFTTRTFDSWTTKHQSPSSHAACNNLYAENLWTNTRYILQTETRQTGIAETMTNISYRNIHAKNSLISVMGHEDNNIYDVTIENVECAFLRIGTTTAKSNNDVTITNARTGRLWLMGDNITIYDSVLLPELKYDYITAYSSAIMFYGNDLINNGRINVINCHFDASNYTIAFARSMTKLKLINTIIEGSTSQLGLNVDAVFADKTEVIGCRLETQGTTATEFSGRMESTIVPTLRYSSKVQSAWMGRQRIESGTDLNDIKVAGGRFESHGSTATSLINIPSEITTVFFLDVDSQNPTDSASTVAPYFIQKITLLNCTAVYMRSWNGSTWSSWYKYSGTAVS